MIKLTTLTPSKEFATKMKILVENTKEPVTLAHGTELRFGYVSVVLSQDVILENGETELRVIRDHFQVQEGRSCFVNQSLLRSPERNRR